MLRTPRAIAARAAAVLLSASLLVSLAPSVETHAASKNLVVNGSFNAKAKGWRVNDAVTTRLKIVKTSKKNRAARLTTTTSGSTVVLNDLVDTVRTGAAGVTYSVSARVKSNKTRLSGQLRVREVSGDQVITHSTTYFLPKRGWKTIRLNFTTTLANSTLDLNVLAWNVSTKRKVYVDSVKMSVSGRTAAAGESPATTVTPTPSPTAPSDSIGTGSGYRLSNGCALNARGVGTCAPIVGAAHGSNTDPTALENSLGQRLGVRRTYWGASQVDSAIRVAKIDVAAGRIPWISFKLGYSWSDMAAGKGDAWAKDLAAKVATVNGPVWVAFHHEPEGDGDITAWTKMQERLGPIIRTAPNAAFTVILTGWNQIYGQSQYSLDSLWPNTTVDVAGFDIYCSYGTWKDGKYRTGVASLKAAYFDPIAAWAKRKGVAWGLAETGLTDEASAAYPNWISATYAEMASTGGIALSYFDTTLNSDDTYHLTGGQKTNDFATTLKKAPAFPAQS